MTLRGTLVALATASPLFVGACFHDRTLVEKPTGSGGAPLAAPTATGIVISDAAFGPLDASIPATLDALRTKLVGYEVKATRDEHDFLQYDAYHDGVLVLSVSEDRGRILNVITTDPRITVAAHPSWHAGAMFADAKQLSRCGCWGGKYVCWKDGEHVAASFERGCTAAQDDVRALVVLDGTSIQRLVWNPTGFGATPAPNTAPSTGGGLGGNVKLPTKPPKDPCDGGDDDDE
ncbi:MAG: hypothetical protein NT062_13160 [Proteobacteria bacterium]|nr:hypothetical protein [Pseudomonadota bacterium]